MQGHTQDRPSARERRKRVPLHNLPLPDPPVFGAPGQSDSRFLFNNEQSELNLVESRLLEELNLNIVP